ncbi:MAG: OmpA/MotB family protein [Bacillota bacterium]
MPDRDRDDKKVDTKSPAWMTTFGDMMTLLLVFFVLMYSFSVMDLEKFEGFISALQNRLGVLEGGKTISDESQVNRGSMGEDFNPSQENLEKVMGDMQEYVEENELQENVEMEMTEKGLVVRLTGRVLYDIGEAVILPEGRELLAELANAIQDIPNNIMVEGHTDDWPINTEKFPSNWELSTTRATNVIKFMIEELEVDPGRLSAAGYSEYRPLKTNDTAENRAQNRRVEIVILNTGSERGNTGAE